MIKKSENTYKVVVVKKSRSQLFCLLVAYFLSTIALEYEIFVDGWLNVSNVEKRFILFLLLFVILIPLYFVLKGKERYELQANICKKKR